MAIPIEWSKEYIYIYINCIIDALVMKEHRCACLNGNVLVLMVRGYEVDEKF